MQIFSLNASIVQRNTTPLTGNGNMKQYFKYKCKVCKKGFQFPKGLKEHNTIHTGKISTLVQTVDHHITA